MASTRKKTRTTPPEKGEVRVRILPKDPLVARRDGLWPVEEDLEFAEGTVGSGPTGPRAVVVDYNADLDVRFAPAQLLKDKRGFRGIAGLSNGRILDDFGFHQVNVWAIVERTLGLIEDDYALARPIPWASGLGRLILLPHAGYQENAFYDRGTGALHFFYFEGPDGKPVYTCLSHDIVAHELGHAVLDGLKPYYNEVTSPETAGFHEYFGDAMAIMAALSNRETAKVVTRGGPDRLPPKNVISAIASEFGAALYGNEGYLRGAWKKRTMGQLRGTFEEHDWSEVLTGVYYDLLHWLYREHRKRLVKEERKPDTGGYREYYSMKALNRAATVSASVMFRGLDYCPPVDLRYREYARAVLRADEVAYPVDTFALRDTLLRIFRERGLNPLPRNESQSAHINDVLRGQDISAIAGTPAGAYRFLDAHREDFGIPFDANFSIASVYNTKKLSKSGYRPPREQIIEFVWSEDVRLDGKRFGALAGSTLPLHCGGTVVFDSNGNFLHLAVVPANDERKRQLRDYAAYLVKVGDLAASDGVKGIGAPGIGEARIQASIDGGRARLTRSAAMRHVRTGAHT